MSQMSFPNEAVQSQSQLESKSTLEQYIQEYIESLDETEKLVLEIAKDHLESSFCIERSVGFVKWLKDNSKTLND
jgi:hypothetical protein